MRHHLLLVGTALVLGVGVYLFHEVRLTPAQAQATTTPAVKPPPAPPEKPAETPVAAPTPPSIVHVNPNLPRQPRMEVGKPSQPPEVALPEATDPDAKAHPKLDALMAEANKAFDRGEYDDAKAKALQILATSPGNVRMLRVMVSAACADGEAAEAQKYYAQLPAFDRGQMKVRCERSAVTFTDVPLPK